MQRSHKNSIKVILVEPSGTINVGSVARLCENYGISELCLVSPRCDPLDAEAIKMAVKGSELLKKAKIFNSLIDAISDCTRIIATCGRIDHGEIPLHNSEDALKWFLNASKPSSRGALVFGREDRGLSNEELNLAQKVLTLETSSKYRSLNLSHAVAIVLHQLSYYENKETQTLKNQKSSCEPASAAELNDLIQDAKEVLIEIGFLLEHTATSRMSKIKRLLQRSEIRSDEVSLIRGIPRQIRWAISNRTK